MIDRLEPRERTFVFAGALILTGIFIWLVLINPYLSRIQRLDLQIEGQRRNLERVETLRQEIVQLRQQLDGIESTGRTRRPLFAQVESLTTQMGVRDQLLSMRPQPDSIQGGFRQQSVEIRLERVTLSQLVGFLHAAEYRSNGIQVRSLRVRPRFDDRSRLDVNLVLMSLERA